MLNSWEKVIAFIVLSTHARKKRSRHAWAQRRLAEKGGRLLEEGMFDSVANWREVVEKWLMRIKSSRPV